MLMERRTKHVEYRGVKLMNPEDGAKLPDGSLIMPIGVAGGEVLYGVPGTHSPDAAAVALARPLFSEAERLDTEVTGKTVVLEGSIEIETDMFITADEAGMRFGVGLTAKKDADGVLKFGVAAGSNVVIGKVAMAPGDHPEGRLVITASFR